MANEDHAAIRVGAIGSRITRTSYALRELRDALFTVGNESLAVVIGRFADQLESDADELQKCSNQIVGQIVDDAHAATDNMMKAAFAVAAGVEFDDVQRSRVRPSRGISGDA